MKFEKRLETIDAIQWIESNPKQIAEVKKFLKERHISYDIRLRVSDAGEASLPKLHIPSIQKENDFVYDGHWIVYNKNAINKDTFSQVALMTAEYLFHHYVPTEENSDVVIDEKTYLDAERENFLFDLKKYQKICDDNVAFIGRGFEYMCTSLTCQNLIDWLEEKV